MLAILPTAAQTASVGIKPQEYGLLVRQDDNNEEVLARYWATCFKATRTQPETKTEITLLGPNRLAADWLGAVQDRIHQSIVPRGKENDGRWLSEEIAAAGSVFFELTSDILPGEPYLYSSKRGDLVAEFETEHGVMTGIITQEVAVLFAVVDGIPVEGKLALDAPRDSARQELRKFTGMLHKQQHGSLETKS